MDIKFEGLDEVIDSIEKLGDTSNLSAGIKKACTVVERSAKEKVPKGTGALRRSITSKVDVGTDVVGTVYTPLFYAPYVEYGTGIYAENGGRTDVPWRYKDDEGNWHMTSGMKPQPYMKPALDENRSEITRIIKGALK